jgi:hypothetical protein
VPARRGINVDIGTVAIGADAQPVDRVFRQISVESDNGGRKHCVSWFFELPPRNELVVLRDQNRTDASGTYKLVEQARDACRVRCCREDGKQLVGDPDEFFMGDLLADR